ncbi:MAG: hypothetical protein EOO46_05955 [Flavobacterium sp.]|nr:MAG: hypothetical protein EOO46_05955 [Flavobacterium sp.]
MKREPRKLLSLAEISEALSDMPLNEQMAICRWNALKMLRRSAEKNVEIAAKYRRLAGCGLALISDITLNQSNNKEKPKLSVKGISRCKGINECVYCSHVLAVKGLKRINQMIQRFKLEYPKGGFLFITYTIPRPKNLNFSHKDAEKWHECCLLLVESWNYFSSAFTSELREKLGWVTHAKKIEENYCSGSWDNGEIKGAGIHIHIHSLVCVESYEVYGLDELQISYLLHERWNKSVRHATKSLRESGRASLDWIDLRRKNVVAMPFREESEDSRGFVIRGGLNVVIPTDASSTASYIQSLAAELNLAHFKENQGSYSAHTLPLLYETHLKDFAKKAFEFHVVMSRKLHKLEFGRYRKDGRNCGIEKYLSEKHPLLEEAESAKVIGLTTRGRFNRQVMSDQESHKHFSKELDSGIISMGEDSIFRPVEDDEIREEIEDIQQQLRFRQAAKGLFARGLFNNDSVFWWYFNGDELRWTTFLASLNEMPVVKNKLESKTFKEVWREISPLKKKRKSPRK